MIRSALLLIFTLIIVPLIAWKYGNPLSEIEQNTLVLLAKTCFATAIACFFISEFFQNYSQVDKLWSIMPLVYSWVATYESGWNLRMIFLSILVSIWGVRLSYNFARRGGYSWKFWEGEEDYRWAVLRAKKPLNNRWFFMFFNLFFISLYQHFLILLFTLPIILSIEFESLQVADYFIAIIFLGWVFIEWLADEQQWQFQTKKQELIKTKQELTGDYKDGFLHSGLWSYVRHPNYAAEQAIWLAFYLFSVVATGLWVNWSIAGSFLLLLLFKSSSDFSESISVEKYPAYKKYQEKVGRFIPKIF